MDPVQRSLQLKRQRNQRELAKRTSVRRSFFKKAVKEADVEAAAVSSKRRPLGAAPAPESHADAAAAADSAADTASGSADADSIPRPDSKREAKRRRREEATRASDTGAAAAAAPAATLGGGASHGSRAAGAAGPERNDDGGRRSGKQQLPHILQQPNRFSAALGQRRQNELSAQVARQASDDRRAEIHGKMRQRKSLAHRYHARTHRGQPIMSHRAKDLLSRVERVVAAGK